MEFKHIPVLLNECITNLDIKENGTYLDCTLGGGGHSQEILKHLKNGKLIAFDKDVEAINATTKKLNVYNNEIEFVNDDFKNSVNYLKEKDIMLDGILIDLGVSSYQIDNIERGFSYVNNAPLDMRMDKSSELTAKEVVNTYTEQKLTEIFFKFGEEDFSKRIAKSICEKRNIKPIENTVELAEIISQAIPAKFRFANGNPAKKVFQAIRIEVNGELEGLEEFIKKITLKLKKNGKICVISFHSLEDRAVKQALKYLELKCICDARAPMCTCNKIKEVEIITKKPILPTLAECEFNSRAKSSKLRVAKRI